MEKIDRLGWAAGITFTAYGRKIGVRVNDPKLLDALPNHLPYGWKPSQSPVVEQLYSLFAAPASDNPRIRRFHLLFRGSLRLACSLEIKDIFQELERDARWFVAEHAVRRVFVHAAVVGWRGRAIVIPGKSLSGKTTLAAEFVRAGAVYYSDEYAVFDQRGRVHPYAKPLSIRGDQYTQTDCPVEDLGGRQGSVPLPVGVILVSGYKAGAAWRPRRLSPAQGAMALLANSIAVRRQPEKTLDVLRHAVSNASILKSMRGEAAEMVNPVLGKE
jgi:hypothetical protein